jgi:hypothetical protein
VDGKPQRPSINGRIRLMLLNNSLSAEIGTRAEKIDLHNRPVFNEFTSAKVSPYPEKNGF